MLQLSDSFRELAAAVIEEVLSGNVSFDNRKQWLLRCAEKEGADSSQVEESFMDFFDALAEARGGLSKSACTLVKILGSDLGLSSDYIDALLGGKSPSEADRKDDNTVALVAFKEEGTHLKTCAFIDRTGDIVSTLPGLYATLPEFSEGLARKDAGDRIGYMNTEGEMVIPPLYDSVSPFSESLALVRSGDELQFIDRDGNIVFYPESESSFHDGLVRIMTDDEAIYYMDKKQKVILPPYLFDECLGTTDFSEGVACAYLNDDGSCVFFDKKGDEVSRTFIADKVFPVQEGIAAFELGGKYGFVDKGGNVVIRNVYDESLGFSEGVAAVRNKDRWGFIDNKGQTVIPFGFEKVLPFAHGLAAVRSKGLWGYIDHEGKTVIPNRYVLASGFSDKGSVNTVLPF